MWKTAKFILFPYKQNKKQDRPKSLSLSLSLSLVLSLALVQDARNVAEIRKKNLRI